MEESFQARSGKGRSGARIVLIGDKAIKIGRHLENQYLQCEALYPITPEVFGYLQVSEETDDGLYIMERLSEPPEFTEHEEWSVVTLRAMRAQLEYVWQARLADTARFDYKDWQVELETFCREFKFEVAPLIVELGLDGIMAGVPYPIHGDPTLANVMIRKQPAVDGVVPASECIVICDPIAPRGKIPAHYTVDIGKMLQSAIGWETHLYGLHIPRDQCVSAVLGDSPQLLEVQRSWFWCMVHLIRILPYVHRHSRDYQWAHNRAVTLYSDLKHHEIKSADYAPITHYSDITQKR